MTSLPVIFGLKGLSLDSFEETFFRQYQPQGFILFDRNCRDAQQITQLVESVRAICHHKPFILIDQEGGKVQRLPSPPFPSFPAANMFGLKAETQLDDAIALCAKNATHIGKTLHRMGINVNCAPVLDLPQQDAHPIIGSRAFSHRADVTTSLGRHFIDALQKQNVHAVIKHIPGHGRAKEDSHLSLPIVDTHKKTLMESDFLPFQALARPLNAQQQPPPQQPPPWAMTAHVTYTDIDARHPATLSPIVIQDIIRDMMAFDGVLITDDIAMHALSYLSPIERARSALNAGCDLVLHCPCHRDTMRQLAENLPPLREDSARRITLTHTLDDVSKK